MPFTDWIFQESGTRATGKFWLISDLQQRDPKLAERYFRTAMDDFKSLNENVDGVCYLGDAAEGIDRKSLQEMTEMQIGLLNDLNVPVYYVMGNHELDLFHHCNATGKKPVIPFFRAVKKQKNWHTTRTQEEFFFAVEFPTYVFLFFSDHAAEDGSWVASHQRRTPQENYPYPPDAWCAVRDEFERTGKPVFSFSHYAFPGGNRPSEYLAQMCPLPENFRAHFYGHAHIGDAAWAGENLYRKISGTEHLPIPQFDIASLDHLRGTTVRSAILHIHNAPEFAVFFRDHRNGRWEEAFISEGISPKESGTPESFA